MPDAKTQLSNKKCQTMLWSKSGVAFLQSAEPENASGYQFPLFAHMKGPNNGEGEAENEKIHNKVGNSTNE